MKISNKIRMEIIKYKDFFNYKTLPYKSGFMHSLKYWPKKNDEIFFEDSKKNYLNS